MNTKTVVCEDGDAIALRAAEFIALVIANSISARGRAMVALAGGSTPEKTYRLLARPDSRIDWANVFLFMGDERFVSTDDERSNFGMVRRSLLDSIPIPDGHVFPVATHLETAEEAADAYVETLAQVFGDRSLPPRFDLVLLGLGDDGHTASLFPGAPSLMVQDRWVASSPAGTLPPPVERVTFTYPVLNAAREVVFLVSGKGKAAALEAVLSGQARPEQRPAGGIHPRDGSVTWIVDRAAVGDS